jgi:hypothetical protein
VIPDLQKRKRESLMAIDVSTSATPETCQPFNLDVMVFSPEAGYKFELSIDRSCSPTLDSIWKLIFDLYKVNDSGSFDQIVHVAFTATLPEEQAGVQNLAVNGVSPAASDAVVSKVYPAAKALDGVAAPTDEQKAALHDAMHTTVTSVSV